MRIHTIFPIYQRMELITERKIWIDKIGLERDAKWKSTIYQAIQSSYGVIFAVTDEFINRPFILEKEIPWAVERFNNSQQGKLLFPILIDDVELPIELRSLDVEFVVQPVDARSGDYEQPFASSKTTFLSHRKVQFPSLSLGRVCPTLEGVISS